VSASTAVPRGLDAARLGTALGGEVVATRWTPLPGGLVADTFRVHLTWRSGTSPGPSSVIVKAPAADATSRAAAERSRGYEVECAFYRELAGLVPVRVPRPYLVEHGPEGFVLVLEDLLDADVTDEAVGLDTDRAALVVDSLARLHAFGVRGPRPAWLDRHRSAGPPATVWARYANEFLRRFGHRLADDLAATVAAFGERAGAYDYYAQSEPRTICHGDVRPDNIFFCGDRAVLIDWQTVRLADGVAELAYALGAGMRTGDRRLVEPTLLARYAEHTGIASAHLRERYRANAFAPLARGIRAAATLRGGERAESTVVRLVTRGARLVLDTGALDLLQKGHLRS
jgi:aminoglycoside phosphotransferase (APT) family kinase protein